MDSKIKTFEDACTLLNYPTSLPSDLGNVFPEKHIKAIIADYQLGIITEALNMEANDGNPWEPNWNDWDERKYYPWPTVEASNERPSGSGFSGRGCVCDSSGTGVGSRHCFKTRELVYYAFEQFNDLYQAKLLLIK